MIQILAPISLGELLDKISILEIKKEKISGDKLTNINKELRVLLDTFQALELDINRKYIDRLKEVNGKLWLIEDAIRHHEKLIDFEESFIELARSVYLMNDVRSSIKKEINLVYGSDLIEEKSYCN